MKTTYCLNEKRVSRKALEKQFGKERISRMIEEAKAGFLEDPLEQQSFFLGSAGRLTIEFA